MTVRIEQSGGRGRFFVDNVEGFNVDTGGNVEVAGQLSAGSLNLTSGLVVSELQTNAIDGDSNLVFQRVNSEKMRLTREGALLLGSTSNPYQASLNVTSPSPNSDRVVASFLVGDDDGINSQGAFLHINDTSQAAAGFYGVDIGSVATLDSPSARQCDMVFRTTSSADHPSERMRLTSSGYLKVDPSGSYINSVGTAHEFNSAADASVLLVRNTDNNVVSNASAVTSILAVENSNGNHFEGIANNISVFRVRSNGDVQNANNSYGGFSDLKLKENIVDASPKLDDINKVRFVNYDFKEGSSTRQFGVIAQELEEIFPALVESTPDTEEVEVVSTDEEGNEVTTTETRETGEVTKSVKYSVLTLMAVKALQEASAKIDALEARLAALEAK